MFEELKRVMHGKGISTNQLSFMSRIAQADLYQALSGKKPLYPNWRKRIAEALGEEEDSLFPNEEEANHCGKD